MKKAFYKDIIFNEIIENVLKKYLNFSFKYSAILNNNVISGCKLISYGNNEYLITNKSYNNWHKIDINIHGIKKTYYVKQVQYIENTDNIDWYNEVV